MRINSPTSQILRRRFHNKASKLQRYIPYQEPRRIGPNLNPNFAVSAVIAACASVWGYQYIYTQELLQTGSRKARRALDQFENTMVCSLNNIKAGRHYTLLTSTFTHISPWHLAFNMMVLWGFGTSVTMAFGAPTFAILWVGAGLTGGLVQTYAWMQEGGNKDHRAVGASGSIMGIIGALTTVVRLLLHFLFQDASISGHVYSCANVYDNFNSIDCRVLLGLY